MPIDAKVIPIGPHSDRPVSGQPSSDPIKMKIARLPAAVHAVREKGVQSLKSALGKVFDNADDALFELADKAQNNHDQNLFFESMREVRLRRRAMESAFFEAIDSAFSDLTSNQVKTEDPEDQGFSAEGLKLVQNDELEELVAVDSMASKAARNSGENLQHLSLRLDSLVPLKVYQKNNPVGPDIVCSSFAKITKILDADIKAKLVLFKLFEKYVVSELGKIYEGLNGLLIDQNILPSLSPEKIKKSPSPQNYAAANPQGATTSAAPVVPPNLVQTLVGGQPVANGSASDAAAVPAESGVAVNNSGQLLQALSQLQSQQVSGENLLTQSVSIADAKVDLTEALAAALVARNPAATAEGAIGNSEKDVINLVKMLFDFILDDRNLAEPMKALIGRLQIPVLKVALIDNTFFSKSGHPARRLLNEMATAALGWQEEKNSGKELTEDPLYKKIAAIVQSLLSEFEDNVDLFADLLADFVSFIDKERKRARIIEQRTIDAESGKAQAEAARDFVAGQLAKIIENNPIPESVQKILDVAWSNVLFLIKIREGIDNDRWRDALETAKDLVWSVSAPINAENRHQLMSMLPKLLKRLRNGLESISYNPYEMTQLLGDLEKIHLARLRSPVQNQSASSQTATPDPDSEISKSKVSESEAEKPKPAKTKLVETGSVETGLVETGPPQKSKAENAVKQEGVQLQVVADNVHIATKNSLSTAKPVESKTPANSGVRVKKANKLGGEIETPATDTLQASANHNVQKPADEYLQRVRKLTHGTWFEMNQKGDSKFRCRLAAIINATGKYIFVNRSGQKVAEHSVEELALALQNGTMRLLDDGMLFDRALQSVIGDLRKSRPA